MKSAILFSVIALGTVPLAARAYTPVRPLSQLGEQDPVAVVAQAPESAQATLPVRYWRGQASRIDTLTTLTNALTNGQIVLQGRLRDLTLTYTAATNDLAEAVRDRDWYHAEYDREAARAARLDALRAWLVALRDAATLPTTKALYQAIIDRIDDQ